MQNRIILYNTKSFTIGFYIVTDSGVAVTLRKGARTIMTCYFHGSRTEDIFFYQRNRKLMFWRLWNDRNSRLCSFSDKNVDRSQLELTKSVAVVLLNIYIILNAFGCLSEKWISTRFSSNFIWYEILDAHHRCVYI